MTEDEDYDALSQKHLASIKRDMRVSLEDAAVRATHKVMAEFEVLTRPEQQAVFDCPRCGHVCSQRPWQGLTPDEVKHLYPYGRSVWGRETFEAIEKALKEKNSA